MLPKSRLRITLDVDARVSIPMSHRVQAAVVAGDKDRFVNPLADG